MIDITTPNDLFNLLASAKEGDTDIDRSNYRYVIYARKSTNENEGKQIRSLPDQIDYCIEYAVKNSLKVIGKPIAEAESAKESDTRPKFRQMMDDIKAGKYEGIIAWHPDRLARNMKDAGEVIDLIDREIIKDLQFCSFTFENNPSGKMLLGIMFAISKEYSDKLSANVDRGNQKSIEEGKMIARSKHGYYKDPNQLLRPDEGNFLIIKKAFRLRLENKTLEEIAEYLNNSGYTRLLKGKRVVYRWDKQKVQKMLHNPVYAGVLLHGKNIVDLTEAYDFEPAIDVKSFMKINSINDHSGLIRLANKYRRRDSVAAPLLKGMVYCDFCGEHMYPAITKKETKESKGYLYLRCDTEDCERTKRNIRAEVIMKYIYDFLDSKPFASPESYNHYKEEMKKVAHDKVVVAKSELQSKKIQLTNLNKKYSRTKDMLLDDSDQLLKDAYKGDLAKYKADIKGLESEIKALEEFIENHKVAVFTYEEFLELFEKTAQRMRKVKKMSDIDSLVRKLYLNFYLGEQNVVNSTLCSPFKELLETKVSDGGRGGTRTLTSRAHDILSVARLPIPPLAPLKVL